MAVRWPFDGRSMAVRRPFDGRSMAVRWPCDGRSMAVRWPFDGRSMRLNAHELAMNWACIAHAYSGLDDGDSVA
eukprot:7972718-Lingulodinium_polyedra.AAC.1